MHSKIYGASKRYNPALRGVSWVALVVKNPPSNAGDHKKCDSISGSGISFGVGNDNPLQYS